MAIEADQGKLFALLVREAGKTGKMPWARFGRSIFRYYAARPRSLEPEVGRRPAAPVACISPWNFPLAFSSGRLRPLWQPVIRVIAKPAEQTPHCRPRRWTSSPGPGFWLRLCS